LKEVSDLHFPQMKRLEKSLQIQKFKMTPRTSKRRPTKESL